MGTQKKNITRKQALKQLGSVALGSAFIPPLTGQRHKPNKQSTDDKQSRTGNGQSGPPNIIFLMTDQQRADCLGVAGNDAIKTPNIDEIARHGVFFNNAYSEVPSCTPARACLLTGQTPWNNGMLGYGRVARKYKYEMPSMIRKGGYYTYGIGKNHWFPQKSLKGFHGMLVDSSGRVEQDGYVSDYHDWFKQQAPGQNPNKTGLGWNSYHAKAYALNKELHPTHWIGQRAVDFIQNYNLEKPLYLKVSWERPHSPYDPPQQFLDMYKNVDIPEPFIGGKKSWDRAFAHYHPDNPNAALGNFGTAQAIKSRRHYYANVTFIDRQIGRIIDTLKQKGMYNNSFIFFCSDHGDMLGDHYHWRKTYAYEGSSAIPFVLKWPEGFDAEVKRGIKLDEPVGLQDVLPTFLQASGQQVPEDLDGMSLLNLIRGNSDDWRTYIGMEHATAYFKNNYWAAVTDGHYKYIWFFRSGQERFFNLDQDPGEVDNLVKTGRETGTLQTWRDRLVDHLKKRGPGFVKDNRLVKRKEKLLYSPNYPDFDKDDPKWLKYWNKKYSKSYDGVIQG